MTRRRLLALLAAPALQAGAQAAPTAPDITDADLRRRLEAFAHDSLAGRSAGSEGHRKATAYLARELQRLGLRPAGDSGTFLQALPFVRRRVPESARLVLGDSAFVPWEDFFVRELSPAPRSLDGVEIVVAGTVGMLPDSLLAPEAAAGKLVILAVPADATVQAVQGQIGPLVARYAAAAGIGVLDVWRVPPQVLPQLRAGDVALDPPRPAGQSPRASPLLMTMSRRVGDVLRTRAGGALTPGTSVGTARGDVRAVVEPSPSYNVVAVVPGRDPALAGQYVALGAHSDHEPNAPRAVDHDSVRAYHQALVDAGAEDPFSATREQRAAVRVNVDSLRRARPARMDSIHNGADDDGSGSVALLEIAERLATLPESERPRRSVLLVWHTAEELGLVGARWYSDRPTVPRDSIVTMLNVDMIGRGGPRDVLRLGGPGYLQVIGSRRLSTELGDLLERTNTEGRHGFTFDYQYDATGHPQQYYCRSDHYMYARFGIPVAFMSTGGHADYHQVTDEPQYIDYPKLARVTRFVGDVARRVADLDRAPVVDRPKPDPNGQCVQ